MDPVMLGTIYLLVLLILWRFVMVRQGALGFWQVAARMPDKAFDWFLSDDTWTVVDPEHPVESLRSRDDLVGPFKLAVPKVRRLVTLYADAERLEASQAAFLAAHQSPQEARAVSWPSYIALAYPLMASMTHPPDSSALQVLGYGLANLGYLLAVAGIVAGHFRALGLNYRVPSLIAAAGAWLLGTLLINIGA